MNELFESALQSHNTSQKNSRVSGRTNTTTLKKNGNNNQKVIKQPTTENAYRAFILPQYQSLCEYSFLNNNYQSNTTTQQTKDKLNEINSMLRNSSIQTCEKIDCQKESKQLKNENTINWLKKRYYDSGNKKYFGDQDDVQQSNFIRSIFENITKHLKTPEGIQINDFNKLIQQYELPLSFQVLSKMYQIADHDRDSILNLNEFQELILNDNTNKIFLEQFKNRYKSYSNVLYKPTSLSALCIFISFRINHDFLTEFLYDPNFQVKDKSQGLIKMLDLIKVQGQTRIKNDFDKRMIRKLNVEQTAQLGFVTAQQKQINEKQQKENNIRHEMNKTKQHSQDSDSNDSIYDQDDFMTQQQENQNNNLPSIKNRSRENSMRINYSKQKLNKQQLDLKIKKSEFQSQMENIVEQANKKGENYAKQSYSDKKLIIEELQLENIKQNNLTHIDSTKSLNYNNNNNKKNRFLPCLNLNTTNQMYQNSSNTNKFHNIDAQRTLNIDDKGQDYSKQMSNLSNSSQVPQYFRRNASQGDVSNKNRKMNYSKQMAYLMDVTLQESINCKQSQIARKLMNVEDSAIIQQYKKQMDQIKIYQEQKKQLASSTPSPVKNILTAEILQQLEGTSFVPKHKSFFPQY